MIIRKKEIQGVPATGKTIRIQLGKEWLDIDLFARIDGYLTMRSSHSIVVRPASDNSIYLKLDA